MQKIRRKFGALNAGPRVANCLLAELRHRHNIKVAKKNRKNYTFYGHYDTWYIGKLKKFDLLYLAHNGDHVYRYQNWISMSDFSRTNETFGICRIPEVLGFSCFDPGQKLKLSYRYLAEKLGTLYPVIPIHTDEEKAVFKSLIQDARYDVRIEELNNLN